MASRQLPPIPERALASFHGIDATHIKGNVSDDSKRFYIGAFKYFVGPPGRVYGAKVGQRIKPLEVNVWGVGDEGNGPPRAEIVLEVEVTSEMCNTFGIMHGACIAYIIDQCSVASLVTLGYELGWDGTGVTQSMNIIWNQGVRPGATLKIVATSLFFRGRSEAARCEVWDGNTLCATGVNSLVNPWKRLPSFESPATSSGGTANTRL